MFVYQSWAKELSNYVTKFEAASLQPFQSLAVPTLNIFPHLEATAGLFSMFRRPGLGVAEDYLPGLPCFSGEPSQTVVLRLHLLGQSIILYKDISEAYYSILPRHWPRLPCLKALSLGAWSGQDYHSHTSESHSRPNRMTLHLEVSGWLSKLWSPLGSPKY